MQASQEGHVDIVNLLIEYGAKTDHQTEVRLESKHMCTFPF